MSSDSVYTTLYILIGIMTILGSGGLFGMWRSAKKQGVRDAQLDQVIAVVLPDKNGNGGLINRFTAQDRKLDDIQREAKPNGGTTQRLGDVALRTEAAVKALGTSLDQHLGASDVRNQQTEERFKQTDERLKKLEGKPKPPPRSRQRTPR